MGRFSRQILLPEIGEEGQQKLENASVLIVGLGGLGCPVALYLAGAGIGRIGLADIDTVGESNLHRQLLYDSNDIGKFKVHQAATRLKRIAPNSEFDVIPEGLNPANGDGLIQDYDLIVDCCDNYRTRYLLDDLCRKHNKDWIFGSIQGFEGMISVFGPNHNYASLFSDRDALEPQAPASGGVIGPTPGTIGAIQAAEAIKILTGNKSSLRGKLLLVDLLNMKFNTIDI